MDHSRWEQLQYCFEEALKLPEAARAAFLQSQNAEYPGLAEEVMKLLEADAQENSLLNGLILPEGGLEQILHPMEGQMIGPYQIQALLGRGGMGAVYRAQRVDGQFEQQVAIKLLKKGMDSDALLARFRTERQIQARLEHGNIARLLGGGLSHEGQPYFSMEYIEGQTLDQYCDQQLLSVSERLALFLQVCDGIQYAHSQLVIHRDLKPSNIMVSADGQLKILDFGIARLLDEQEGLTMTGNHFYTPDYASPEQVSAKSVGISTDIYSLGVILYELLSGFRPLDLTELSAAQREQKICHEIPKAPSQIARKLEADQLNGRSARLDKLPAKLAGDLDLICLKALRKEPERRYETVQAFAEDIRRYLTLQPVLARPDSMSYRSKKFYQRNRLAIQGVAVGLLLLIGMTFWYTWQLGIERDRAQQEAAKAQQVSDFLVGIFEANNPLESQGDTITARQLLDQGTLRIQEELTSQPELKIEMYQLLGNLYSELGLAETGRKMYGAARQLEDSTYGPESEVSISTLLNLAKLELDHSYLPEARQTIEEAMQTREKLNLAADEELGNLYFVYGDILLKQRKMDSAYHYLQASHHLFKDLFAPPHERIAVTLQAMGIYHVAAFEEDSALQYLDAAMDMYAMLAERDGTLYRHHSLLYNKATALMRKGESEEALRLFDESLALTRKNYGPLHPFIGKVLRVKSGILADNAEYAEAEALLKDCLTLFQKVYGPDHNQVAVVLGDLGTIAGEQMKYAEAEAYHRRSLAIDEKENNVQSIAISLSNLAISLENQGRIQEAETYYLRSIAIDRSLHGHAHPYIADGYNNLGQMYEAQGEFKKAMDYYHRAFALLDSGLDENNRYTATTYLLIGRQMTRIGNMKEAIPLLQKGLALREALLPANSPHISTGQRMMAEGWMEAGDYEKADSLLQLSVANLEAVLGADHPGTVNVKKKLAELKKLKKE